MQLRLKDQLFARIDHSKDVTSYFQYNKKPLLQRLFYIAYALQNAEYVNQTFGDELNFNICELDHIYDDCVDATL